MQDAISAMVPPATTAAQANSMPRWQNFASKRTVTKTDLYTMSLSGTRNSDKNRKSILGYLNFPDMSANAFLDLINVLYGYDEFLEVFKKWQQEQT